MGAGEMTGRPVMPRDSWPLCDTLFLTRSPCDTGSGNQGVASLVRGFRSQSLCLGECGLVGGRDDSVRY